MRWLLGVRSPGAGPGDEQADAGLLGLLRWSLALEDGEVVRTDGPEVVEDLSGYAEALLAGGPGWYAAAQPESPDVAGARREVARVIAQRVRPSFLDARFAATGLDAATGPQALDDPAWLASLDQGSVGQFARDLAEVAALTGFGVDVVTAVLRASAFALGAGVPWADIWPAIAGAVLGRPLADSDAVIEQVTTGRLEGYLLRAEEDGRVVYAPVHQHLAEVLRDDSERLAAEHLTRTVTPSASAARRPGRSMLGSRTSWPSWCTRPPNRTPTCGATSSATRPSARWSRTACSSASCPGSAAAGCARPSAYLCHAT